jgi:hypothetical protein
MYKAPNHELFQDGGLEQNNPIGLAVREAAHIWPNTPEVHLALSIGTGYANDGGRVSDKTSWFASWGGGWLARCIDNYEKKLDSERLWQSYVKTLKSPPKERHHRLNVKVAGILPTLDATGEIEKLNRDTEAYFCLDEPRALLQHVAETIISSVFYPVLVRTEKLAKNHYSIRYAIFCQLDEEQQIPLFKRLQDSSCVFSIHPKIYEINFPEVLAGLKNSQSFEQEVELDVSEESHQAHIYLLFGYTTAPDGMEREGSRLPNGSRKYDINGSPVAQTPNLSW